MDWYLTLFEVIDMRSFSNLWFWIALAVPTSVWFIWWLGHRSANQVSTDPTEVLRHRLPRSSG